MTVPWIVRKTGVTVFPLNAEAGDLRRAADKMKYDFTVVTGIPVEKQRIWKEDGKYRHAYRCHGTWIKTSEALELTVSGIDLPGRPSTKRLAGLFRVADETTLPVVASGVRRRGTKGHRPRHGHSQV